MLTIPWVAVLILAVAIVACAFCRVGRSGDDGRLTYRPDPFAGSPRGGQRSVLGEDGAAVEPPVRRTTAPLGRAPETCEVRTSAPSSPTGPARFTVYLDGNPLTTAWCLPRRPRRRS